MPACVGGVGVKCEAFALLAELEQCKSTRSGNNRFKLRRVRFFFPPQSGLWVQGAEENEPQSLLTV